MKTLTLERPILFSRPMVRAILAGRKMQTRRVAKEPLRVRLPFETWVCEAHAKSLEGGAPRG